MATMRAAVVAVAVVVVVVVAAMMATMMMTMAGEEGERRANGKRRSPEPWVGGVRVNVIRRWRRIDQNDLARLLRRSLDDPPGAVRLAARPADDLLLLPLGRRNGGIFAAVRIVGSDGVGERGYDHWRGGGPGGGRSN